MYNYESNVGDQIKAMNAMRETAPSKKTVKPRFADNIGKGYPSVGKGIEALAILQELQFWNQLVFIPLVVRSAYQIDNLINPTEDIDA